MAVFIGCRSSERVRPECGAKMRRLGDFSLLFEALSFLPLSLFSADRLCPPPAKAAPKGICAVMTAITIKGKRNWRIITCTV